MGGETHIGILLSLKLGDRVFLGGVESLVLRNWVVMLARSLSVSPNFSRLQDWARTWKERATAARGAARQV